MYAVGRDTYIALHNYIKQRTTLLHDGVLLVIWKTYDVSCMCALLAHLVNGAGVAGIMIVRSHRGTD